MPVFLHGFSGFFNYLRNPNNIWGDAWTRFSVSPLSSSEVRESGLTQAHMVRQENVTSAGGRYILEVHVKRGMGSRDAQLRLYNEGANAAFANVALGTGTLGNYGGTKIVGVPTVTEADDGYYRVSMTVDTTDAAGFSVYFSQNAATDTDGPSYAGDGTSSLHIRRASMRLA